MSKKNGGVGNPRRKERHQAHNKRREAALLAAEKERVQQEIRDKAAQLGLAKAQARVAEKERLNRETKKLADKAQREALEKRAAAIIELKHNIDKNTLELKALNEKRAMREKRKSAFEKEKAEIEARGENPYQVFLQRDIDKV